MKKYVFIYLIILFSPLAIFGAENLAVSIKEWKVPWESTHPRDPYVAPNGLVWFVGQTGHYAASFDPILKVFKRYDLEEGTGPHNLIVAEDGMVWYAGNLKAHIGRLNPQTGQITQYSMPDPQARDPHTLVFDRHGHIWFTVQWGNFVGRLNMKNGHVDLIPVPTPRARPYGIVVDRNDRPWIVELGSNKLFTIDPDTLKGKEIELPRKAARPRRLGATSNGHIWYVDYSEGYLSKYIPNTGQFQEWQAPSGSESLPYGMTVDHKNRVWYVETGPSPNQMVGFDPATEAVFSLTPISSGAGSVRHMFFNKSTREIWFGTDTNYLGKVVVPD